VVARHEIDIKAPLDTVWLLHTEISNTLWGGAADGIMGIHEWVFTQTPTGVHVATHESFSGQPVQADTASMQSILDKSLIDWLGHLKATAED
jgi:hypothetical protein